MSRNRPPDTLTLGAWASKSMLPNVSLVRFTFPEDHYQTLLNWAPRSKNPSWEQYTNVVLEGLSEILAFFVPEVSFMDSRYKFDSRRMRLAVYLLDAPEDIGDIQLRTEAAINFWLANIYGDKPAEMRLAIASSAQDSGQWKRPIPVPTTLQGGGRVCAAPEDTVLYSALTALAVRSISGTTVQFRSGREKRWIVQTPHSGIYDGVELVAFPPELNSNDNTLYSEYVSLKSASFPERAKEGVHLIARASIRNWGPIKGYDRSRDPSRSLDFFIPRGGASPSDYENYAHSRIMFKAKVKNWNDVFARSEAKIIEPQWGGRNTKCHVFDIVRQLIGAEAISKARFMSPVIDHNGAWSLPRLAPGSHDKGLAGGSGLGWHDRSDVSESLDEPLAHIGFNRTAGMSRIDTLRHGRNKAVRPFRDDSSDKKAIRQSDLRRRTLAAIRELGIRGALTFLILHVRDKTPEWVEDALKEKFGPPDRKEAGSLVWEDGLVISVVSAHGGFFSQLLPDAGTAGLDLEGLTDAQAAKIRGDLQDQENKRTAMEMEAYLDSVVGSVDGVGCAIVEMPAGLRNSPLLDPYHLGRRVLARRKLLPKVILFEEEKEDEGAHQQSGDGSEAQHQSDEHESETPENIPAAASDCLRMLGVVPFDVEGAVVVPAAVGVVQRNRRKGQPTAEKGHSIPIAVRVRQGRLEGALPNERHAPEWSHYAHVVRAVLTGAYERFGRGRNPNNRVLFENYINDVFESLNAGDTPTIVFLDGSTLRGALPELSNTHLKFDRLIIGAETHTPQNLPRLTLVRINSNAEEIPQYSHEGEVQWTKGLFRWDDAKRTVYGTKRRPQALKKPAFNMHGVRGTADSSKVVPDSAHRKGSALDEMCVIFAQPEDDIEMHQVVAHRLRGRHAHYAEDTQLPFPLHELRALSKAINS